MSQVVSHEVVWLTGAHLLWHSYPVTSRSGRQGNRSSLFGYLAPSGADSAGPPALSML